jgi:hypothetical protein
MKKFRVVVALLLVVITGACQRVGKLALMGPDSTAVITPEPETPVNPTSPVILTFDGLSFLKVNGRVLWEAAMQAASDSGFSLPTIAQMQRLVKGKVELGLNGSIYWTQETIPATQNCPLMIKCIAVNYGSPDGRVVVCGLLQEKNTIFIKEDEK